MKEGRHFPRSNWVCAGGRAPSDFGARDQHMTISEFEKHWTPEPYSGCWLWTSWQRSTGYGGCRINGRLESAHRLSWMLFRGNIPNGKCVLHNCDTPPCVNPDHLFLGSHAENMRDMNRKGRGNSRLTEAQVAEIKLLLSTETNSSIARRFGVWNTTIGDIRQNESWKDIQPALGSLGVRNEDKQFYLKAKHNRPKTLEGQTTPNDNRHPSKKDRTRLHARQRSSRWFSNRQRNSTQGAVRPRTDSTLGTRTRCVSFRAPDYNLNPIKPK